MRLAAVVALAFLSAAGAGWPTAPAGTAASPVEVENARPGTGGWRPLPARAGAIEGYTSQPSVAPGDELELHVSTRPDARYRVDVYRLGWYGGSGGRLVACLPGCDADEQGSARPIPAPQPGTGYLAAGWPVTDSLRVSGDWVSGYYLAVLRLTTGPQAGRGAWVPFVVRASDQTASAILVQASVNTWQAYNRWGGFSLYRGPSGESCHAACSRVSFDRPYDQATPNFWDYELPLVHFLEQHGYDVSYTTDVDTDRDPGELLRHRLVVVAGHDEYWTKRMRDGFEAARDAGTNLAFLGANIGYWQIRYADNRRTIVEYRVASRDPEPNPALKTVRFRSLDPPRPECELLGVQYYGDRNESIGGPFDYAVDPAALADPWLAGTGFDARSTLPGLVGYEWDVVTPGCPTPPLTVLFRYRGEPADADAVRYRAASGARVFSAGSLNFTHGLDEFVYGGHRKASGDPRLERFVQNMLADQLRPAPASRIRLRRQPAGVRVVVRAHADPRVLDVRVYRGPATDPYRGRLVCVLSPAERASCLDRRAPQGTALRYAAVVRDPWGTSVPLYSAMLPASAA